MSPLTNSFDWALQVLGGNSPVWEQATICEFSTFLAQWTLHDSYWNGLFLTLNQGAVALLHWDMVWNTLIPQEFNRLVIRFHRVHSLSYETGWLGCEILADVETEVLSEAERTALFDSIPSGLDNQAAQEAYGHLLDEKLTRTRFLNVLGAKLELIHSPEISFLCFNQAGEICSNSFNLDG